MFKFLKDAFKPDQPETVVIPCLELPAWLDSLERNLSDDLASKTADSRNRIGNARERLLAMVDSLASAERQEAYHPKLGQVTKNTLPLFEKAMHSACSRKFPEEPEEFYKAATESLKGCIGSMKGQGRYLQAAYPTETYRMRLIVDEIGKEINSMNPAIAEIREKRRIIHDMRHQYADLLRNHALIADRNNAGAALSARIVELQGGVTAVRAELAGMAGSPASREVAGLRDQIRDAHRQLDEAKRDLSLVINTVLHVFRKAEKMAGKKHDPPQIKAIKSSVSVLERYETAGRGEVIESVALALPPVLAMIGSGEVTLKNKEEKQVFTAGSELVPVISAGFERYQERMSAVSSLEEALTAHPHTHRGRELEQRLHHLEGQLDEAEGARKEYEERVAGARAAVPGIQARLNELVNELAVGGTRISVSYGPEDELATGGAEDE